MLGFADFDDFLGWCFRGYTQQQYAEASAELDARWKAREEKYARMEAEHTEHWDRFFQDGDGEDRPARELYRELIRRFHPDRHQSSSYLAPPHRDRQAGERRPGRRPHPAPAAAERRAPDFPVMVESPSPRQKERSMNYLIETLVAKLVHKTCPHHILMTERELQLLLGIPPLLDTENGIEDDELPDVIAVLDQGEALIADLEQAL